jgi:hypothetical protein
VQERGANATGRLHDQFKQIIGQAQLFEPRKLVHHRRLRRCASPTTRPSMAIPTALLLSRSLPSRPSRTGAWKSRRRPGRQARCPRT